jgi:putative ABC transport system permease protein
MRDWQAFARQQLHLTGVRPGREARLVDEVAVQLEDLYRDAISRGVDEGEADRLAREHVPDWTQLSAELAASDRAENVPALDLRLEEAASRPSPLRFVWQTAATVARDLRTAARALARRPAGALVLIVTLALGIGASTAIFSALHAALLRPLPYAAPDRLVMGRATFDGNVNPWVSAPDFFDYRDGTTVFEALSAYMPAEGRATVPGGYSAQSVPVMEVSWDLFHTLGVSPARGRAFSRAEGERRVPDTAIISHGYWQRALGGTPDVVGRALRFNYGQRTETVTIVGVMPEGFQVDDRADVWLPMQVGSPANQERMAQEWLLVGRLKPEATLRVAQEQVDAISLRLQKSYPSKVKKALRLTDLQEALADGDRSNVLILMAAVAVLLLAACADVAGLLLSRGVSRQTEMAIRSALGATRADLVRQLLAESLLAAAAAGALGLALAVWLRGLVLRLVPLDSLGVTALPLSAPVIAFAVGVTLATSVLVGLVPAWFATRTNVAADLKSGTRTSETRGRALARQGLVAFQVALSVTLLVAAALLGRSLMRLKAIDPGFRPSNLLTARIELTGDAYREPASMVRFFTEFTAEVRALPGVRAASAVNYLPIVDPVSNIPVWDADRPFGDAKALTPAFRRRVLPGYFDAMGIPLVAGRGLAEADTASGRAPVAVISQSLARRLFPGSAPLGRRVAIGIPGGPPPIVAEVVGIVGNAVVYKLTRVDAPALYVPYQAASRAGLRLVVRTSGDPDAVAPAIRAALARRDRTLVLADVKTMEAILGDSLRGFGLRAGAIGLFGGAALLLAMLGVYGVLAFTVTVRRGDIGLRMVVGASRARVLWWVMARGMMPVGIGLVLGIAAALGMARWLQAQLFDVPPTDVATFVGVTLCLVLAAVAACLVPAWRAMHVDPVVALRGE